MTVTQNTQNEAQNESKLFAAARLIQELDPSAQTMKMQKLLYYVQGWSLALTGDPMIESSPQAYKDGPVYPAVREDMKYCGNRKISNAKTGVLSDQDVEIITTVVDRFRRKGGKELADATHLESPWLEARGDLAVGAHCSREMSLQSMMRYFLSVPSAEAIRIKASVVAPKREPGADFFRRESAKWSDLLERLGA